jgi:hypothetical protein
MATLVYFLFKKSFVFFARYFLFCPIGSKFRNQRKQCSGYKELGKGNQSKQPFWCFISALFSPSLRKSFPQYLSSCANLLTVAQVSAVMKQTKTLLLSMSQCCDLVVLWSLGEWIFCSLGNIEIRSSHRYFPILSSLLFDVCQVHFAKLWGDIAGFSRCRSGFITC